jgi:DNA-directed RNA polymerase specialized sigma24 family protein
VTVINLARTSLRQRLREIRAWREVVFPRQAEPALGPDMLAALARLPQRKRACVVLRYYLDLSEADTAAALGISVGTVRARPPGRCSGYGPCSPMAAHPR